MESSYDFDAHEWDVWTPISGGMVGIKDRDVTGEDPEAGLPVMATNDRGEFIRSEVLSWWFRCNWAGKPLREDHLDTDPMPGVLKLRVQLTDDITYTAICAAVAIWNMPNVGVLYRKVTEVFEWPDGTRKVGNEWHYAA